MLTSVLKNKEAPNRNDFLIKAKSEFYKSISIYPKFHWSWYNLGLIYNEFGNADSAIYVLNKVLQLQPKHINTQGLLGSVYGKLKNDYPKAISYLQTAVKYNPNDVGALENLGIAYAMNKNYDEALQTMQKALQLNPNNPQTYNNIGSLYGNMGDTIKSKEYFAKAKQLGGQ
jgi:tetratricopeptide (TPR) repeat protein